MIIPENNTKSFGAVYINNDFEFIGFCKESNSYTPQQIDVYINNNKITTITTNKNIEELDNLYDLGNDNLCFSYSLPEEFIDEKAIIQFINHHTEEELENSPCALSKISSLSEICFIKSLKKPMCKNINNPKGIGFLGIEENIHNKNFVKFIKKLYKKFPKVILKVFYFKEDQKEILQDIFVNEKDRLQLIIPKNTRNAVADEIDVFIGLDDKILESVGKGILKYNQNIILVLYPEEEKAANNKLSELISIDNNEFKVLKELGIPDNHIQKCNNKFIVAAWDGFFKKNKINYNFNHNMSIEEYFINILDLSFKYPICKEYALKINFLYYKAGEME